MKKRLIYLLVFLLLISLVSAAELLAVKPQLNSVVDPPAPLPIDIKAVVTTDKTTYDVGDDIIISVNLEPDTVAYDFDVVGVDVLVESSDRTNTLVDFNNALISSSGNIYDSLLTNGLDPLYQENNNYYVWQIQAPYFIEQVAVTENILSSFKVKALASGSVTFSIRSNSVIGQTEDPTTEDLIKYNVAFTSKTITIAGAPALADCQSFLDPNCGPNHYCNQGQCCLMGDYNCDAQINSLDLDNSDPANLGIKQETSAFWALVEKNLVYLNQFIQAMVQGWQ